MSETKASTSKAGFLVDYGEAIEAEIEVLQALIESHSKLATRYPSRWLALKLLEGDSGIQSYLQVNGAATSILGEAERAIARLQARFDDDVDTLIADRRYSWINQLACQVTRKTIPQRTRLSDKVDRIVTSRWLGIPIFLLAMWFTFKLTTDVAAPMVDWVDGVFSGPVTAWVVGLLASLGLGGSWLESLLVDGVIAGVGGVLVFVPVLAALFSALAVLEDSGYMARAAFVMDRIMQPLGLHGKSFLPMLIGFGCTVPAIYATRTLENRRDRLLTGLLVPFMSCGARLPVYILFATIFFPRQSGAVVFAIYLLGIFTAFALGLLLSRTVFRRKASAGLVIEMPSYRLPDLKGMWSYVSQRTGSFIRSAATMILLASVLIWLLAAIPVAGSGSFADTEIGDSAFARLSGLISPAFAPLGFESWQSSGALITGFIAKEVVISTIAQTYGVAPVEGAVQPMRFAEGMSEIGTGFVEALGDTLKALPSLVGINLSDAEEEQHPSGLASSLRANFESASGGHGALAAMSFMVFVLLYTPCVASLAAERQELGTKWMWVSIVGQLALAWGMAFLVYQGGLLLGLG